MADRFIGIFDMLGFRNKIESTSLAQVVTRAKRFVRTARGATIVAGPKCFERLSVLVFQDTILVTTPTSSDQDLKCVVQYACALIGFAFHEGFMIRGAVVRGQAHVDNEMVVGKGIVHAHRMEQAQDWMGCWLEDACIEKASRAMVDELKRGFIVHHFVPLKTGPIRNQWALNWTQPFYFLGEKAFRVAWNREWKPACTEGSVSWDVRTKLVHTDRFLSELVRLGWLSFPKISDGKLPRSQRTVRRNRRR